MFTVIIGDLNREEFMEATEFSAPFLTKKLAKVIEDTVRWFAEDVADVPADASSVTYVASFYPCDLDMAFDLWKDGRPGAAEISVYRQIKLRASHVFYGDCLRRSVFDDFVARRKARAAR